MIKIINGTFGFRKGAVVIPLTKDSEPIELPKDLEKRLVEVDKIAEYVETPKKSDKPQYDRAALITRYKELGLPGNPASIKSEVLDEAIKQASNNTSQNDEDSTAGDNQTDEGGVQQPDDTPADDGTTPEGESNNADENGTGNDNNGDDAPDLTGDGIAE